MKQYFEVDGNGFCYNLEHWKRLSPLREREIVLEQAQIEFGTDYFYCEVDNTTGIKGVCGTACKKYAPRNSKSGRCKHNKNCYTGTGKYSQLTKSLKLLPIA